jgi:hypothetical protein
MRKMLFAGAVLALLVSTTATTYAAGMTWGAEIYGAFNTYSMGDVNDNIDTINENLQQNGISEQFDKISNGFTGGIALRMWANPTWQFNVGWEPIYASSSISMAGLGDAKIDTHAQLFQGTAAYFFPTVGPKKFGIGAGPDILTISGNFDFPGEPTDVSGTAFGFHVQGMGEWTMRPGFAITGTAGYRLANVSDTKFDDKSPDPKLETDYSGFIGRVGLAFYLPTK